MRPAAVIVVSSASHTCVSRFVCVLTRAREDKLWVAGGFESSSQLSGFSVCICGVRVAVVLLNHSVLQHNSHLVQSNKVWLLICGVCLHVQSF